MIMYRVKDVDITREDNKQRETHENNLCISRRLTIASVDRV